MRPPTGPPRGTWRQDMEIVEAQQRKIDLTPGYRDMPIEQELGLKAAHRILNFRGRAERRANRLANGAAATRRSSVGATFKDLASSV